MLRYLGSGGAGAVLMLCLGWVKDVSEAGSVVRVILVFTSGVQLEEGDRCWGSVSCCVPRPCPHETCLQRDG